ncbi:divergent polysaccharide deacetylase family protein [Pelosinus sp. sgz500959]|uniref:divergent polysaccharide deacetylase family protein n=1 Tax=Pelosinus sp. sgz500959 TaxID=3242472 RepID=UPI00366DEDAB
MARKTSRKNAWMIVLALIVMGVLYLKASGPSTEPHAPLHDLEKTGAGTVIDFTGQGNKIHTAVDEALKKNGLSVSNIKEAVKEVPRQKVEGVIRWHTRQLLVNVPVDMSAETLQQTLQAGIKGVSGQVISSQPDNYQGLSVVRLDIGLKDHVAGEDITVISDQIYLTKEKTASIVKKPPEVKGRGQMAIVIDDFGYSKEPIAAFAAIGRPLTFAVLPYRPFSNEAAARGMSSGHQVMLHLPMEPLAQGEQSEKITITINLSDEEIHDIAKKAIQSIPGLIGVNNHQGSRATADRRVMKAALGEIKENNLFFLDSRTNSQSIGAETARQMGVRTGVNELFIDNTDDVNAVKAKLRTAQDMAIQHGIVTVIGHARMNTAKAVSEMVPELEANGIQLIFVSQVVK